MTDAYDGCAASRGVREMLLIRHKSRPMFVIYHPPPQKDGGPWPHNPSHRYVMVS